MRDDLDGHPQADEPHDLPFDDSGDPEQFQETDQLVSMDEAIMPDMDAQEDQVEAERATDKGMPESAEEVDEPASEAFSAPDVALTDAIGQEVATDEGMPESAEEVDEPVREALATDDAALTDAIEQEVATTEGMPPSLVDPEPLLDVVEPSTDSETDRFQDVQPQRTALVDAPAFLDDFRELTLAEVVGQFLRSPRATFGAFSYAIQPPAAVRPSVQQLQSLVDALEVVPADINSRLKALAHDTESPWLSIARLVAVLLAVWGCSIFVVNAPQRTEGIDLEAGLPFVIAALLLWVVSDLVHMRHQIGRWVQAMPVTERLERLSWIVPSVIFLLGIFTLADASDDPLDSAELTTMVVNKALQGAQILLMSGIIAAIILLVIWLRRRLSAAAAFRNPTDQLETPIVGDMPWYMSIHPLRILLVMAGIVLSGITWFGSANNNLSTPIFYVWLVSVALWSLAFAPRSWWTFQGIPRGFAQLMRWMRAPQNRWVLVVMLLVLAIGGKFRLDNLTGNPASGTAIPQEMTSDHVEKLLDAQRVKEGSRNIFFANNGGREPFQMYAMALFSELPGQSISYNSLKLLAVVESLLTLPFLFWLGYDLFRTESTRFRCIMGVLVALLVAVSFWDVTVTRLALRIILTPLVASFLLVYLARAMRTNDIGNFIKVGWVLGFGLYTYQAVRMLPVVVIVAILMAVIWGRYGTRARLLTLANFVVLVWIAFVAFLPMYHYSTENPDQFLRRTVGRILGDDVVEETLPNGVVMQRAATVTERVAAFTQNAPVLLKNIRNAILMFNWKGDVAWINNVPNYPALDRWAGGLFLVGIMAWIGFAIRRRDAVYALVPIFILIMLLPSALSIAYPIENPSFTRTSGSLPAVYLICALPLALLIESIWQQKRFAPKVRAVGLATLFVVGSYTLNDALYMNEFPKSYIQPSLPYSDAGRVLQGFALSDGSYGNAFMIAYPYWWDNRAVGLAAGIEGRWENGVYDVNSADSSTRDIDYLPYFMQAAYVRPGAQKYYPERDLLFFYSAADAVTSNVLREWFPDGQELLYPSYQPGDDFVIFRVPPLGEDGYQRFLLEHPLPQ